MVVLRSLFGAAAATALLAAPADTQAEHRLHFLTKQCNEDAIHVLVDPRALQEFVGSDFPLKLEEGKARVVIVVHDCSQCWIDAENLGPSQDVQVWVSIQGPEDVRPVIGAERTMPTRTWFNLFAGSSNPRVRATKTASGTAQAQIEGMHLDAPGPRRHGRVSLGKGLQYSWEVLDAVPLSRMIGLNHDVYVRDAAGNLVLNQIQAILHVCAGPTEATLTVAGDTNPLPWIAPGTYPATVTVFFPMWSRATLGSAPSR